MSAHSPAQDQAFVALARRRGVLDEATLARVRAEGGSVVATLLRTKAVPQHEVAEVLRELVRLPFRCPACGLQWSYDALEREQALACQPCRATLEPALPARTTGSDRIGPYELGRELGRGSMGVVYSARKPGVERPFALKVMRAGETDPELVARFAREADVASRIAHPGIVSVLDRGDDDGRAYYVMELCPGPTLKARLGERKKLPPHEAAKLVRDLADAAAAAHAAGVIHRDLKPANVILEEPTGRPRITDFGLARDTFSGDRLTRSGDMVGTPYYMAPEQVRAEREIDERADVYALGVVLYECLAGRRPFESKFPGELGKQILAGERRPLREAAPGTPEGLEAIALKAFSVSRAARYRSAGELRDDLGRFLAGKRPYALPVAARREPPWKLFAWCLAAGVFVAGVTAHLVRRDGEEALLRRETAAREQQRSAAAEAAREAAERARKEADEKTRAAEAASRARRPEAADLWQRARAAGQGAPSVELGFARFLLRRNHAKEAIEVARGLLARGPAAKDEALEARSVLAGALLRTRPPSIAPAREELAKLAAEDPGGARGLLALAQLAFLDGQRDDALRAARASIAREDLAPARALVARALAVGFEPWRGLGRYVAEANDPATLEKDDLLASQALANADRAVELAPDDTDAIEARSLVRVDLHVFRWYALDRPPPPPEFAAFMDARMHDNDDAIELAGSDASAGALRLRGRLRTFLSGVGDAREDLDRALQAEPGDTEALVLRAVLEGRDRGPVEPWLRRALEQDERRAWALLRHSTIFAPERLEPLVMQASEVQGRIRKERLPDLARAHAARLGARIARASESARALLREGVERAARGAPLDAARAPFDEACEQAPGDPVPALELARLLAGRSRLPEALGALDRARSLGADPVESGALRGEVLLRAGRLAEARAELEPVARLADGATRLVALAGLRRASGDFEGARESAGLAVQAAPDDPDARIAFAAALLDGDGGEPDAACHEAAWAEDLEGQADAEALALQVLGAAVAPVLAPDAGPPLLEITRSYLKAWDQIDALAPVARFHVKAALAFRRASARSGIRDQVRVELERARALDPSGLERLRKLLPDVARELGG